MIKIIDNLLTDEECDKLINLHTNSNIHMWRDTYVLTLQKEQIPQIITSHAQERIAEWGEIVKWPTNSSQQLHLDTASENTKYTSITYLNDDFEGGETLFEDGTIIKPKRGRTLMFSGVKYIHGVNKITEGVRYTLPIWYK